MKDNTRKKIVKWFWILVTAPFAILLLALLLVGLFAKIPSFEELEHPDNKLATQVIAENGEVLATFHIENRTYVSYDELSEHLVQVGLYATTLAVAQGTLVCMGSSTGRGQAAVTSPAPARSAAEAHRQAAPAMPSLPATTSTWPFVPLCASRARTGSSARASCSASTS